MVFVEIGNQVQRTLLQDRVLEEEVSETGRLGCPAAAWRWRELR